MKNSFKIGGAFVGLMIGGGFASGQEILQFFLSHGWQGLFGVAVATVLLAFLGKNIAALGYSLKTTSHKEVVLFIAGPTTGSIIDCLITVFAFCFSVAMFAGAASAFEVLFGINGFIGGIFMVGLTVLTLMLNVERIISILALALPYLIVIILVMVIASIAAMEGSFAEQARIASQTSKSHWLIASLIYVSYNLAAGLPMIAVMGSAAKSKREAGMGGMIGGLLLGTLILLVYLALLANADAIIGKPMPTLAIAMEIHPMIGAMMAITLMVMIYSTAVGVLYSFVVRFVSPKSKLYKPFVIFTASIAFLASFIGFTTIVGTVYSIMGYLGFIIIFIVLKTWLKRKTDAV
ncbi:hypothetical protein P4476_09700 [Ureibacillus terrenus]|uniref:YkvI family membrane protein n=1 Tax=Ureibacillus terrenus TaxID=118246 RepID=UPI002E24A02F|nr:hypothetical protein [Ureibacillus terrenus]